MRKLLLLILILALPNLCYGQFVSDVNSSVIAGWGYALNSEIHDSLDAKTSAVWLTRVSDETGTGVWVFGTSPTFTTDITSPLIIGGTATTSDLSLKTTSGVGESGADMHFLVGNNGATEAMTVLNSGNVGIGINSPSSILHVKANTSGTVGSHPAGQLIIQNPTNSVVSNAVITGYESDDAGNPDQQLWYLGNSSGSNSDVLLLNRRASSLHLGTNDAIRLTIDGDGKVGIGTLSPPERLSIVGNIAIGDSTEGDVDVFHYFSTDGSWTAKYLKYDDGLGEFQFNDDLTVTGDAYHVTSTETDSQFMSKKYIDDAAGGLTNQSVKGDHVDSTAEDFVFDDAYKGSSADAVKADSILVTAQTVRLAIEDSLNGYGDLAGNREITGNWVNTTNPWVVNEGGTGAATFTDGGILLGSGTGAITALGAAANGEIPIGDGTTDPQLATITAGEGIDITNGAASITIESEIATDGNKGIAKFDFDNFDVSSGNVSIKNVYTSDIANQTIIRNDIDTISNDFVFTDAYKGTSADATKADSILVTAQTIRLAIEDSLDAYALLEDPTFTTGITVPANSISDEELDEGASFTWTAVHNFGGATSLEIPAVDNPTTDAEGEIAWDANDDAIEVYMGDEGESALIPAYQAAGGIIIAPDGVNDEIPIMHVDALLYPFGIEIDQVSITIPSDGAYSMVFEEWAGDPPAAQNDIETVTTGGGDSYMEVGGGDIDDAALDADDYIFLHIPATDVDWIHVQVIFHINDGN